MRRIATFASVLLLVLSSLTFLAPVGLAEIPAPHANAGDDQTVTAGDSVTLDGGGSWDLTPDETLTFKWDFDSTNGTDDVDARGESVTTKYTDSGIYTATLTVSDGDLEDTDQVRITVLPTDTENLPPKAIIRAPLPGVYNLSEGITFDGTGVDADNDPLSGKWEFGDGGTSNQPQTTHSYSESRPYHIAWTVNDGTTNNTAHVVIYVGDTVLPEENRRPTADIEVDDTEVTVDERVFFDGSNSSDPDDDPLLYTWDFDISDGLQDDGSTMNIWWTFNDTGTFTVSLQVTDDKTGGWDIDFVEMTVVEEPNDPPEANAGNDAQVQVGVPLTFMGTGSDPDGDNITMYTWDFGDGETWENSETGSTSHIYRSPGSYTATLTVEDENEETGSDTRRIEVLPPPDLPPTANAGEDMNNIMEGDTVYFSGRGSDDFGIAKYEWDFNSDGIWDFTSTYSGDANWEYDEPGIYTAVLRVTDEPRPGVPGPGQTDEDSLIVIVGENQAPTAKIVVTNLFVQAGESVKFTSESTDPEGARLDHAWDLDGDGAVDSSSSSPRHTYRREGNYQVTLTVTDDFGQTDTDTVNIQVTQTYSVELDIASSVRDMDPGESYEFRATLSNKGNGDDQYRITLSGKNSNWATLDRTLVNLNATEKITLTITVDVPDSALSTDDALITVKATSSYSGGSSDADEIDVGVRQGFSLKVDIDVNSVEIKSGESKDAVVRISITNEGNGPDTVRVSFSGDITGYLTSSTPKVDLQPGQTKEVTLSVAVVSDTPSGVASGTISVASTKSTAKKTLEFEIDISGSGDSTPLLDIDPLYLWIIVAAIAALAGLAVAASFKRKPGNSRKGVKG